MLLAESPAPSSPRNIAITASDYCEFLKTSAITDSNSLYETSFNSIVRSGKPACYRYEIIGDNAQTPVTFMGWWDAIRYWTWKENVALPDNITSCFAAFDPCLKSNRLHFPMAPNVAINRLNETNVLIGTTGVEWETYLKGTFVLAALMSGGGASSAEETAEQAKIRRAGDTTSSQTRRARSAGAPAPALDEESPLDETFLEAIIATHFTRDLQVLNDSYEVIDARWKGLEERQEAIIRSMRDYEETRHLLENTSPPNNLPRRARSAAEILGVFPKIPALLNGLAAAVELWDEETKIAARENVEAIKNELEETIGETDEIKRAECDLRIKEAAAARILLLPPPASTASNEEWQEWSKSLVAFSELRSDLVSRIVTKIQSDPSLAIRLQKAAWQECTASITDGCHPSGRWHPSWISRMTDKLINNRAWILEQLLPTWNERTTQTQLELTQAGNLSPRRAERIQARLLLDQQIGRKLWPDNPLFAVPAEEDVISSEEESENETVILDVTSLPAEEETLEDNQWFIDQLEQHIALYDSAYRAHLNSDALHAGQAMESYKAMSDAAKALQGYIEPLEKKTDWMEAMQKISEAEQHFSNASWQAALTTAKHLEAIANNQNELAEYRNATKNVAEEAARYELRATTSHQRSNWQQAAHMAKMAFKYREVATATKADEVITEEFGGKIGARIAKKNKTYRISAAETASMALKAARYAEQSAIIAESRTRGAEQKKLAEGWQMTLGHARDGTQYQEKSTESIQHGNIALARLWSNAAQSNFSIAQLIEANISTWNNKSFQYKMTQKRLVAKNRVQAAEAFAEGKKSLSLSFAETAIMTNQLFQEIADMLTQKDHYSTQASRCILNTNRAHAWKEAASQTKKAMKNIRQATHVLSEGNNLWWARRWEAAAHQRMEIARIIAEEENISRSNESAWRAQKQKRALARTMEQEAHDYPSSWSYWLGWH